LDILYNRMVARGKRAKRIARGDLKNACAAQRHNPNFTVRADQEQAQIVLADGQGREIEHGLCKCDSVNQGRTTVV
jgi:hypothetical protein